MPHLKLIPVLFVVSAVLAAPACRIGFEATAESWSGTTIEAEAGGEEPGVGAFDGGGVVVDPPEVVGDSGTGPAPCTAGTFLDNAGACAEWTRCGPGEFVSQPGSTERDQTCELCREGQTSFGHNAVSCVRLEACPAGTMATTASGFQPNCRLCAAGSYCEGGAVAAEACAAGTWDHDADAATACLPQTVCAAGELELSVGGTTEDRTCRPCDNGSYSLQNNAQECAAWSVCAPGSFIELAGSSTADVTCAGCSPGSFAAAPGQGACATWTDCQPGELVTTDGDAMSDRSCQPCPPSTFSTTPNVASCTAVGECPPGKVQTAPATQSGPAVCADCVAGEFCAGGTTPPATCAAGFWDHDADPSTACAPRTQCLAGSYEQSPGSSTSDRTCATCGAGTFSTAENATSCSAWSNCAAGSYVETVGSATRDRVCTPCEGGFSSTVNAASCTAWAICTDPLQYMVSAPTSKRDRVCGACTPPQGTGADNETMCRDLVFQMSGGQVVMEAEHYTSTSSNGSGVSWGRLSEPGISGDAGMALGAGDSWHSNIANTAPRLVYRINFTTSGTFTIYIRGDSGPGGGLHDSCWAGMDNVPFATEFNYSTTANTWDWQAKTVTVSTGVHTFTIWGREDEFEVDKIVITKSGPAPTGNGPPESARN